MIKFIKKNPAIPQRWIVLTALAYSLTAAQAQTPQAEKAFIKENMEFATKQYSLMMQTPAQGKNGKAIMPHSMRKDGTPSKGSIYLWTAGFFLVHYGIYQTTQATKLCKTLP